MIMKCIFAIICAFQRTKVKRCFEIVFFHFTVFRLINAKIDVLMKIRVAGVVFIEMKCRWLQTGMAD